MELTLKREILSNACTLGSLSIDGKFECFTLEDKVREVNGAPVESWKIPGSTAIPRGRYPVDISYSNRFSKYLPEITNVEGFKGIRIHGGNNAGDTEGCILLGQSRGNDCVLYSQAALKLFMPILQNALKSGEECWITVE